MNILLKLYGGLKMIHFAIKYPHLARFCRGKGVKIERYTHTHQPLVLKDIIVDPVPRHLKKDYAARKSILNRCIGLVYKHNVLNRDRINRLKGNDYIRFWSLVNELKVGVWLEKQGLRIRFDPPTKAGGRGEF